MAILHFSGCGNLGKYLLIRTMGMQWTSYRCTISDHVPPPTLNVLFCTTHTFSTFSFNSCHFRCWFIFSLKKRVSFCRHSCSVLFSLRHSLPCSFQVLDC